MLKRLIISTSLVSVLLLGGCDDAEVAQRNMRKAADNFEIVRRIVFYNAIRDTYMLEIVGKCSISATDRRLSVICKTGPDQYKRHFLGVSDNAPYFLEQLEPVPVNVYHYRVTFKPQTILPDIDFRGDTGAAIKAVTPDRHD